MQLSELKFETNGLIPVVVQEADGGDVLMIGYMNREALQRTVETGKVWYWSRSRQRLWLKGETSGNYQRVRQIIVDCDGDSLLVKVDQLGEGACHQGYKSCFHRELTDGGQPVALGEPTFDPARVYGPQGQDVFKMLYDTVADRRDRPTEDSYTAQLFQAGIDKILKKLGKESTEVIIAAKNDTKQPLLEEAADLLYHLTVLLAERGLTPNQMFRVLDARLDEADAKAHRAGTDGAKEGKGEGPNDDDLVG